MAEEKSSYDCEPRFLSEEKNDNIISERKNSEEGHELEHKDSDQALSIPFNVFDNEAVEAFESSAGKTVEESVSNSITLCWGRSDLGSLFRPESDLNEGVQKIHLFGERQIIQISSNAYHSAAVTSTGDLYMCGSNDEGQVDPTDYDENNKLVPIIYKPRLFDALGQHRVCNVSCGLYHTVCVTATGHAISFGGNDARQLGHSPNQLSKVGPKTVQFAWKGGKKAIIQKAVCGDLFSLFLTTTGEVYSCGLGECTGHANTNNIAIGEKIDALLGLNIVNLAAGSSHALALTSSGELYVWGSASYGQLSIDDPSVGHIQTPIRIEIPTLEKVIGIAAGSNHSLMWTETGVLFGTGMNKSGQLGLPMPRVLSFTEIDIQSHKCVAVSCGSNHTLALCHPLEFENRGATLFGWGSNSFNQISKESTATMFRTPIEITSYLQKEANLCNPFYISAGGDQSFVMSAEASPSTSIFRDYSGQSIMKRQFSTQASRAIIPLDATELSRLIFRANEYHSKISNGSISSDRELSAILSTAGELFSSASLLAGSFINRNNLPLFLDIDGIELCYKAVLQIGTPAVVRVLGALQQILGELESSDSTVPESAMRILVIIWHCPLNSNSLLSADIFKKFLSVWQKLPKSHRNFLMKGLLTYPHHLLASRILKPLQEHLTMYIESHSVDAATPNNNQLIIVACECLDWLYQSTTSEPKASLDSLKTDIPRKLLLSKDLFYNHAASMLPDQMLITDFEAWRMESSVKPSKNRTAKKFFISNYPYLLSVKAKQRLLLAILTLEQMHVQRYTLQQDFASGATVSIPFFLLHISRSNLLQQSLIQVASASNVELKKPLKVIFDGEEGVDQGGVTKEFFQLLISQLLSIEYGMFVHSADGRSLWLNRGCTWSSDEFRLVGTLFGLAMYNGVLLDLHFPLVLYQKLLQKKPVLDDLLSIDPGLHRGLKQLLEYEPLEDVESVFCRSFDVTWDEFGSTRTDELIPNGSNIPVTGSNRELYVNKMVEWILETSIKTQFQSLYEGFTRVIHPNSLLLLRAEELESLMIGTPNLDFNELQSGAEYISGGSTTAGVSWGPDHPTIQAFWDIVQGLNFEEKEKLLLFITGSKKAPLGGLKHLGLKIQRMCPDTSSLPTSHTCFNLLMLPEYSSKEKMKDRLLKAINECEGFGLI